MHGTGPNMGGSCLYRFTSVKTENEPIITQGSNLTRGLQPMVWIAVRHAVDSSSYPLPVFSLSSLLVLYLL